MSDARELDSRIPIIIIHVGPASYLNTTIRALSALNSYRVILVGDDSNRHEAIEADVEFLYFSEYNDEAWNTEKLGYVHTSWLPEKFERFCFERFNVVLNICKKNSFTHCVHLDADIVILNRMPLDTILANLLTFSFSGLSPRSSYFSGWSVETLQEFVAWLPEYFKGDPQGDRHCDLFALGHFVNTRPHLARGANVAEQTLIYNKQAYPFDPNYSVVPLLMTAVNNWDYDQVSTIHVDLQKFISQRHGFATFFRDDYYVPLDFVHLNGYTKDRYHTFFHRLIDDLMRARRVGIS